MPNVQPISINCDMGEAYGIWRLGDDASLMELITHANVACGFHASDPSVMQATVRLAGRHGVRIGAHPSYPDRVGFGRRRMDVSANDLHALVLYQIGALAGFAHAEGAPLSHVKPHGAMYGATTRDSALADALAAAIRPFGVPLLGLAACEHERAARDAGIGFIPEFYADLPYDDAGNVMAPLTHQPVPPEMAVAAVRRALDHGTTSTCSGGVLPVRATSVCVHSDTPNAVAIARAVAAMLRQRGALVGRA